MKHGFRMTKSWNCVAYLGRTGSDDALAQLRSQDRLQDRCTASDADDLTDISARRATRLISSRANQVGLSVATHR